MNQIIFYFFFLLFVKRKKNIFLFFSKNAGGFSNLIENSNYFWEVVHMSS
ncbi:hypothetical protein DDB_G0280139 [Dictyostelium discoideum AX4]|uniref:Uncharacterized protein n=1 Tax=Dictyostelium discoideum TaxID=44689 RepID=Q54VU1_DICDI|nr:hypothetical protein DDB_G0280139 [Dictyostelium discoideum AX4]EAL67296.1 hypothetical protein DDB_G0280139 [Dictyostelium discoideum AX4]|eukprot:XP_641264.1 hypothetical protein DDB_G0280139 [Dictyostelium discoideum AX4]